ncbi:MAG TPA: hypothetical protein VFG76_09245, partial [Candidatus Polarisedimenticolia bacterium]|nr:hypothetical protein [Candidatus Polarisedimenticolia bacterium]
CLEHLDPSRVVDAAISVIGRAESHASPGAGSGPTDQARLAADPGTPRFETMGPGSRSRSLDT